jgi:hypothetical protein
MFQYVLESEQPRRRVQQISLPRISFRRTISTQTLTLRETTTASSARPPASTHSERNGRVQSHLASGGAAPSLPRLGGEAEGRSVHDGDGGEEAEEGGEFGVVLGAGVEAEAEAAWLLSC